MLARVFNVKLKELLEDVLKKNIFGPVISKIHVIEFQKRGLPHAHILIILHETHKPRGPEDYDKIVSAEIPNPQMNTSLFKKVASHMLHGPCGPKCYDSNNRCSKKFPKALRHETSDNQDGYPEYRRRSTYSVRKRIGTNINIKYKGGEDIMFDSRWVVPYNPFLLQKYDCHINVEISSSVSSIKYIHKYCFKGSDRAMIDVINDIEVDEIQVIGI